MPDLHPIAAAALDEARRTVGAARITEAEATRIAAKVMRAAATHYGEMSYNDAAAAVERGVTR
jgi:hypothetical protein